MEKKEIIFIIPARGGSKGIPFKNIKKLKGKPLIAYTIKAALDTGLGPVYVSTDSETIGSIAENYGAKVIRRPENLSGDFSSSEDAILHSLSEINGVQEIVCFLQCTSPWINSNDILNAFETFIKGNYDSLMFVKESHTYNYTLGSIEPIERRMRQDMTQVTELGAYLFKVSGFKEYNSRLFGNIGVSIIDHECPPEIDSLWDWKVNELFFEQESL